MFVLGGPISFFFLYVCFSCLKSKAAFQWTSPSGCEMMGGGWICWKWWPTDYPFDNLIAYAFKGKFGLTRSDLIFVCKCTNTGKEVYLPGSNLLYLENCENWLELQVQYTGELIIKWNPILSIFVEGGLFWKVNSSV